MGFNTAKFEKQEFIQRVDFVEVPALAHWFDLPDVKQGEEKPKCLWKVRGLTGHELALTMEAGAKNKTLASLVEAITNNDNVSKIKEAIGIKDDTPADIMKRLEQLVYGSIEPIMKLEVAVKLAEKFPIEFYMLTNKITMLTGMGMDIKK